MILDGRKVSKEIKANVKLEIEKLEVKPNLAMIIAGDDEASISYMKSQQKQCKNVGIESQSYEFGNDVKDEELLELISKLNNDNTVDGIMIFFPLPKHINSKAISEAININKDVDGISPTGVLTGLRPCTPTGVIRLLKAYDYDLSGKECVVVGRSKVVGLPLSLMLLENNASVSITHSRTKDLSKYTKNADIVLCATGVYGIVDKDMLSSGVTVVDCGINFKDGKMVGDCNPNINEVAGAYTPVPGGVGPMTVAALLENVLKAYKLNRK